MRRRNLAVAVLATITLAMLSAMPLAAGSTAPSEEAGPPHPSFPLLDTDGVNVLESAGPVSPMQTCGQCHDTDFIDRHGYHAAQGLFDMTKPGETSSGRPWDTSPGWFGDWNPITYRYLTPKGDEWLDLGTADWIRTLGVRHVGGGPAVRSQEGTPLAELAPSGSDPETHVLDPATGKLQQWDWEASGTVELNCFLCHIASPDNEARIGELEAGNFAWADTATLASTSVVSPSTDGGWLWNPSAFDKYGRVTRQFVQVQRSTDSNCGQCHGIVYEGDRPMTSTVSGLGDWETLTSGAVFSSQLISASGLNLSDKQEISRPWDLHAGLVDCADCHHSLNNPTLQGEDFLNVDVPERDLELYLLRPSHVFTKGRSAQGSAALQFDYTFQGCVSCHDVDGTHEWLPNAYEHLAKVACETCHIPKLYQPAAEQYDWTVLHLDGTPKTVSRGVEGGVGSSPALITGYEPVILRREGESGQVKLAPYNLVSSWFWVAGDPQRPVREIDLKAAFFGTDSYRSEIMSAFDSDADGVLSEEELSIDSPDKELAVRTQLEALGLSDVHIEAEIQPYTVAHGVVTHEWATQDCASCHSSDAQLTAPMQLATYVPGGVLPAFTADTNTETNGLLTTSEDGSLWYRPETANDGVSTLVRSSGEWIDWVGWALLLMVLVGIGLHALARWGLTIELRRARPDLAFARNPASQGRLWVPMQMGAIAVLAVTGLLIRLPGGDGLAAVEIVHDVVAAALIANALFSLMWHIAGDSVRRHLPRPFGVFDQAVKQVIHYRRRVDSAQDLDGQGTASWRRQAVSVLTLDILLPFELITGGMIWVAQAWPNVVSSLGGLPILAPLHAVGAWLLVSGIVLHVYMGTAGARPFATIRALIPGAVQKEATS